MDKATLPRLGLTRFKPQLLVLARELRGLSQTKLASLAGVTQQAIASFEAGVSNALGEEKITALAVVLDLPISFFEQNQDRLGFGSSSYFYRTKITSAKDRNHVTGLVNTMRFHIDAMLQRVDLHTEALVPQSFLTHDSSISDAAKAADLVRATWNIADGPIADLTHFVEKAGVFVVECPFGTDRIDGTSLWFNNINPIIFVNQNLPADRYRFTIAHELGHLVMHQMPHEGMELQADTFAAELLLPTAPFKTTVEMVCKGKRPTIANLAQLKPYWKVSIGAMIHKLYHIGKITADEKTNMYIMMSSNKMSRNEPQPFPKEQPKLHAALMEATFPRETRHFESIRQVFNIHETDFNHLYGSSFVSQRPKFRLVSSV
jgi:Zn-dependent peptidase ImmA (M78 family)/transcriptional regulator with XRE-family HTH domain